MIDQLTEVCLLASGHPMLVFVGTNKCIIVANEVHKVKTPVTDSIPEKHTIIIFDGESADECRIIYDKLTKPKLQQQMLDILKSLKDPIEIFHIEI